MALTKVGKEGITGISNSSDATAITITSAENVGIGTTSPTAISNYTSVVANNSSGSMFELMVGGTRTANIQTSASQTNIQTRTSIPMVFDTNSTEARRIDANGIITKPLQPAFSASVGSTQTNPANASRVTFSAEIFDQNADYDPSIYVFTAPVTGKYFLSFSIRIDAPDSAADYIRFNIATSNRGYNSSIFDLGGLSGDPNYWNMQTAVLADMDANDTAEVELIFAGGAQQTDISTESYFTGFLAC